YLQVAADEPGYVYRMTIHTGEREGGGDEVGPTDLIRHSGFRRLLVGQGISGIGDWMGTVALMALVLDLSGSSTAVAVILVLRLANGLVLGSSYGTIPLGAGLFGLVSALFGGQAARSQGALALVFFVDALTFVASFVMIWPITELSTRRDKDRPSPRGHRPSF